MLLGRGDIVFSSILDLVAVHGVVYVRPVERLHRLVFYPASQ